MPIAVHRSAYHRSSDRVDRFGDAMLRVAVPHPDRCVRAAAPAPGHVDVGRGWQRWSGTSGSDGGQTDAIPRNALHAPRDNPWGACLCRVTVGVLKRPPVVEADGEAGIEAGDASGGDCSEQGQRQEVFGGVLPQVEPCSAAAVAYQSRSGWVVSLSSRTVRWPQGNWPTACWPIAVRGQVEAIWRMYVRLLRDSPRISGKAARRSTASRSITLVPQPSVSCRSRIALS